MLQNTMTIIGAKMRKRGRKRPPRAVYDTEIHIATINGVRYRVSPAIPATVKYDPRVRGFFIKVVTDLIDISTFGHSWNGAEDQLMEELAIMWEEYAQEDDDKLSPKAQQLRAFLLERFKPIGNPKKPDAPKPADPVESILPEFYVEARLDRDFDKVKAENAVAAGEKILESVVASGDIEIEVYDKDNNKTTL